MGMELLCLDHLDRFYEGDELARARREQLEGVIGVFPWIAIIDAFQHWIYFNPDHSRDQRRDKWLELRDRFGGIEDFRGYEELLAHAWHRQIHPFVVPLYYVEYGIAQGCPPATAELSFHTPIRRLRRHDTRALPPR